MDISKAPIEHHEDAARGRFFIAGGAEITYSLDGAARLIAEHTDVDERYQGQGLGARLYRHLVDYARDNKLSVHPACPYIRRMFEKHPEDADVLEPGRY
jgi:hypothetical protein